MHKILQMTFGGYRQAQLSTLLIRDMLSRITVLDVFKNSQLVEDPTTMNNILCLTPNLLHLFASKVNFSTSCLWQPPAPIKPTPKPVFNTVRDRKRYERNERRKARQQALARLQPTNDSDEGDNTTTDNFSPPNTWQLYNLKTLEISLITEDGFGVLTSYISRHRLFRNLVVLNIRVMVLKVGQRKTFIDFKKFTSNAAILNSSTTTATRNASGRGNQHMEDIDPLASSDRFPNDLLSLHALRCLEECTFRAYDVPGMLLVKDFAFMRRKEDFQTMTFLPKRPKSSCIPTTTTTTADSVSDQHSSSTRRKKTNRSGSSFSNNRSGEQDLDDSFGDDCSEKDNDSDDEEESEERLKTETFWPKLSTFSVYYLKMSPILSATKIVAGLEEVRPGVAFSFKLRPNLRNE
jgi:hypothetical protein